MDMQVLCFVVCDFTLASFGLAQVTNSAADLYTRISGIGSGHRRCFGVGMKFCWEASESVLLDFCFALFQNVSKPPFVCSFAGLGSVLVAVVVTFYFGRPRVTNTVADPVRCVSLLRPSSLRLSLVFVKLLMWCYRRID